MTYALFTPIKMGHMNLSHRIIHAPLTVSALTRHTSLGPMQPLTPNVPLPPEPFSSQRLLASPRLLVEWTSSRASIRKNKLWDGKRSDAVHEKKSFIFCQLWALGRAAKPDVLAKENNSLFVPASPIPLSYRPHPVPHALTEPEIRTYIVNYVAAARNAMTAGFDGVESTLRTVISLISSCKR